MGEKCLIDNESQPSIQMKYKTMVSKFLGFLKNLQSQFVGE